MPVVDLRSDTKTRPTPEMRHAMATAEVGDDMAGEDPTVNRLEAMAADMVGKEAAVYVTSGTQGNLMGILSQCRRGDEVIAGDISHIIRAELGGASVLGGVVMTAVPNDARGMIDPERLDAAIHTGDRHFPRTALVALENTHNAAGGKVLTPEDMGAVAEVTRSRGVSLHLDGARLFNAAVALETPASELARDADTVTFCLSKGLGAPVGSLLCGDCDTIEEARRWRKTLGSAMRQAGVIAAAGIVALETMVQRLAEDHVNARRLAIGLARIPGISIDPDALPTNLVFLTVEADNQRELVHKLDERGVKVVPREGGRWRLATHADITTDDIDYALAVIEAVFREYAKG